MIKKITFGLIFILVTSFSFAQTFTLDIPIAPSNTGSGEEKTTENTEDIGGIGDVSTSSSDLEFYTDGVEQIVGLYFPDVNVPKNAIISNAYIQFQVDENGNGNVTVNIEGHDTDSASIIDTNDDFNISGRTPTTANENWVIPSWNNDKGDAGPEQQTPDIKDILSEIIARDGWSSGNNMAFMISGVNSTGKRIAESGSDEGSPILHIEYTNSLAEIDIASNGNSIVNGDDSPDLSDNTQFGSIGSGQTINRTFTIVNDGSLDLNLTGNPIVELDDESAFTISAQPSNTTLTGGETIEFTIEFTPLAITTYDATVSIANNDSNENPFTFDIQGSGATTLIDLDVTGNSTSITNGHSSPSTSDSTDFGSIYTFVERTRTFTIENIGNSELSISSVTSSNTPNFTISTPPSSTINIGGTTTFDVTFNPSSASTISSIITINSDAPGNNPFTFTIEGIATNPPAFPSTISAGDDWYYLDDGSNQETYWRPLSFDQTGWIEAPTVIGYGEPSPSVLATDIGSPSNPKPITTYFRKYFNITDASIFNSIDLEAVRDDGIVVYINGIEVWRDNLPTSGPIEYNDEASETINNPDEAAWITQSITSAPLVDGVNVVAVEIHQRSNTSSDIRFDFKLTPSAVELPTPIVDRGPYLQTGTPTSVIVKWRTDYPTQSVVNYGTDYTNLNQSETNNVLTTEHEVKLTGLVSNTKHYYNIGNLDGLFFTSETNLEKQSRYIKTAPAVGTDQLVRAWILGDAGTANANQRAVRDAYYNYVAAAPSSDQTDMMLFLGDNAYNNGTDSEYQDAVFENMYEDMLKKSVAWSTLGNHDGYSANSNAQTGPYYDIFTFPTAGEAGGLSSGTEAYYSYDYANIHFIVLDSYDSDRSLGGVQYNWAQSDIQSTTQDWIVVVFHHPPYTKGSHDSDSTSGDEDFMGQMRRNFMPMLEGNGVDLVLSGHSHSYERSYFLNGHDGTSGTFNSVTHTVGANGDGDGKIGGNGAYTKADTDTEGAVYITAGSSGKTSDGSLDHPAMYASLKQLGSCVLEIDGNSLNLKFLRENGTIDDHFTIEKTTSPPSPEIDLLGNSNSISDGDITPTLADDTQFYATEIAASVTKTFTIQNTGAAVLNLTGGVTISGDSEFSINTQPSSSSIGTASSLTFIVEFNPSDNLEKTATITIANDDPDAAEQSYTFTVSGIVSNLSNFSPSGEWKYLDDGSNQTTLWQDILYDDSAWLSGNAQLGYGLRGETTTVGFGPDSNNKFPTTYFRKSFTVSAAEAAFTNMHLDLTYDDGAVVYLNGVEIWAVNMPAGRTYTTYSASQSSNNDTDSISLANALVSGINVIAVEIHQANATSSDISFDLDLSVLNLGLGPSIINPEEVWSYLDDGSDHNPELTNTSFDYSSWATGNAMLAYGDITDGTRRTLVSYIDTDLVTAGKQKNITTYFRKSYNITALDAANATLVMKAIRDDGIVVYINGVEVWRNNMPSGSIDYTTEASGTINDSHESAWNIKKIANPFSGFTPGNYEIAVEIHQVLPTSSDISFDFEMYTNNDYVYVPPTLPDYDGDTVADYLDADDDNDGVPDSIEGCQSSEFEDLNSDPNGVSGTASEESILTDLTTTGITKTLSNGNQILYSASGTFNEITSYNAGEQGWSIRVHGPITTGTITLDFTSDIDNLFFKLVDYDEEETWTVNVYDSSNNLIDLSSSNNIYHLGSYVDQTGNVFTDNGSGTNLVGDNVINDQYGAIYFYFPDISISKIEFIGEQLSNGTTRIAGMQYCIIDTDGDGIEDIEDLDSDNDGIPDLVDSGGVDTDGNGLVDILTDTDGDGLVDIYDANPSDYNTYESSLISIGDFDKDGLDNRIDLDSDNDGIVDIIEAGGVDTNNDGLVDNFTDLGFKNGYHDSYDGAGSLLITGDDINLDGKPDDYPNKNADNTGLPNFLDIDSDDDGITDHTEAQGTTATYVAFSGADTDGDGILDVNDTNILVVGFGGNGFTPEDSDSDGTPDYLDTDSDDDGELDIIEGHDTNGDGTVDTSDAGSCLTDIAANLGLFSNNDTDGDGLDDGFDNDLLTYDPSNMGFQPTSHPNIDNITTTERDWREETDQVYNVIDFDGLNDYIDFADSFDITGSFSIETWVKQDATSTGNGMLVSKRDCNKGTDLGYSFGLVNHYPNVKWYDAAGNEVLNLTSLHDIGTDRWYNLSITYDLTTTTAKIYIDGIEVASDNAVSAAPIDTDESLLIGAKFDDTDLTASSEKLSNEFKGWIDEVRIWNKALTPTQIREMMNQEIQDNGTGGVQGKVLLTDISDLDWADLLGYYPMNTIAAGYLNDESSGTTHGRIRNITSTQPQTAPLPYTTKANGNWADNTATTPWTHGNSVWKTPNSAGIDGTPIDWNIVVTNHDVEIDNNVTVLGLIIASEELQVNGTTDMSTGIGTGHGLYVNRYLKIDGVLDLEGGSQLLQPENSIYSTTSTGRLERDQQGTQDLYTYNYWSSPVRNSNGSNNFSVPQILNDGTTPIVTPSTLPDPIAFSASGYNGATGPLTIADYWIWKYADSPYNNYYSWQHVRSSSFLEVGEGFTMKGVASLGGSFGSFQNYVFSGKPNNGDYTHEITPGNEYLVGNPYPSAIDGNEFIRDNIKDGGDNDDNVINGALYFWEHFASNTHYLSEYEGGYGIYTLMGGTEAITSDALINTAGSLTSTKGAPGRYIPVGQGFFVAAIADPYLTTVGNNPGLTPITGGDILFKNSQRIFEMEALGPTSSSIFMKSSNTKTKKEATSNSNSDTRQKIRLMFNSPKGYHRQLLVGVDKNASSGFDIGYDGILIEDNKEDMFWTISNSKFIIQGVDHFNLDQTLPLGLKTVKEGLASIKIDALENISDDLNIYLRDNELNVTHDLRASEFEIFLASGDYLDRFEVVFKSNLALGINDLEDNRLQVLYSNEKERIVLHNPNSKNIESIELYNILGQSVFKIQEATSETYLEYKVQQISTGAYIIKVTTDEGTLTKKVLIN